MQFTDLIDIAYVHLEVIRILLGRDRELSDDSSYLGSPAPNRSLGPDPNQAAGCRATQRE